MITALLAATAVCVSPSKGAEVIDRVVVSVGNLAITLSDVTQEYGLELFLDGKFPAAPGTSDLERVRERLTYQKLLALELEPETPEAEELHRKAQEHLEEVRRSFGGPAEYQKALQVLGMTEAQVLEQLVVRDRILRMIDQRFQPAASPTAAEIEDYYRSTFLPEYAQRGGSKAPPALADVENQIREILVQKQIDRLLAEWLEELKPSRRVRFHAF